MPPNALQIMYVSLTQKNIFDVIKINSLKMYKGYMYVRCIHISHDIFSKWSILLQAWLFSF